MVKKSFSLHPVYTSPLSAYAHYLPVSQRVSLHHLINLHVGNNKLILGLPKATFSCGTEQALVLQTPCRGSAHLDHHGGPLLNSLQFESCSKVPKLDTVRQGLMSAE